MATQIAATVAAAASGTAHRQLVRLTAFAEATAVMKPDTTERKPDETTGGGSVRAKTASISWQVTQSAR